MWTPTPCMAPYSLEGPFPFVTQSQEIVNRLAPQAKVYDLLGA